jgi:hypothetical protein
VPKTRQEIQAVHAATTRKFIDKFQSKYSEPSAGGTAGEQAVVALPPFYNGSYRQAIDAARREHRMIVVYLHSDRHPNTEQFCRDLCEPSLSHYIRDNFVLWGGCVVHSEEAFQASSLLHATAFPFLAVILQLPSDRSKYIALYAHEGPIAGEALRTNLERVLEENGAELVAARVDQ